MSRCHPESAGSQSHSVGPRGFRREPVTMLTSVHVENSERLLGAFGPIRKHFTARFCFHPLRCSGSGLLQEARNSKSMRGRVMMSVGRTSSRNSPRGGKNVHVSCRQASNRNLEASRNFVYLSVPLNDGTGGGDTLALGGVHSPEICRFRMACAGGAAAGVDAVRRCSQPARWFLPDLSRPAAAPSGLL